MNHSAYSLSPTCVYHTSVLWNLCNFYRQRAKIKHDKITRE